MFYHETITKDIPSSILVHIKVVLFNSQKQEMPKRKKIVLYERKKQRTRQVLKYSARVPTFSRGQFIRQTMSSAL